MKEMLKKIKSRCSTLKIKSRRVIVGCSHHSSASSQPINRGCRAPLRSWRLAATWDATENLGNPPNPLWTLCKETITHGRRGCQIYCHRVLIFRLSLLLLKIKTMAETRDSANAQPTAAPHPAEPAEGQAAPVVAADGEVGQSVD